MAVFYRFHVLAAVVLVAMLRQLRDQDRAHTVALAVLMAGSLGDAIGRVTKRSVADFLLVGGGQPPGLKAWLAEHLGTRHWPALNAADVFIYVGVSLFFADYLFLRRDPVDLDPDPPIGPLEV